MQNFFVGKCLEISQKFHGGDRNQVKVSNPPPKKKHLKNDR